MGFAAASTCALEILVVVVVAACVVFITTWRAILPRKVWEDPSIVGVNRLATHSRLGNYPTFQDAVARGQSPNVVSLRYRCGSSTILILLYDYHINTTRSAFFISTLRSGRMSTQIASTYAATGKYLRVRARV